MTSLRTRGLTVSSALPTYASHPAGKEPCLASSPLSQTSCAIPGPQPDGFYFCVSLQNYSNKPITSCNGKWATPHPIVTTKPDFHSLGSLCLRVPSLCASAWHAVASSLGESYVTHIQLSFSSIQYWASAVQPHHTV